MEKLSSLMRKLILQDMSKSEFDLLVIGGGITGCGIALDAAARGMKTALVEMQDFASGTSSRSTKLVHGGLRYLKQYEVKMVAEVGKERAIVYENGPHVTTPQWMLLPIYKNGALGMFTSSIGLKVYDFLAGVKKEERRRMLNQNETLQKEPLLNKEGLKGSGYYVEYRTDDARLTIEVMKEAVVQGAKMVNYAKVMEFLYRQGKVIGVRVEDVLTGEYYDVYAKKVINATGPWVDYIREKDQSLRGKKLRLTKGVHLVFERAKFPLQQAIYFNTHDGRMMFAIPREGKTYVGTTDTFYNGDPIDPKMTEKDRSYILQAIHDMFPQVVLNEEDVVSSWAGVRPLIHEDGKDPSEISRKDEIWVSDSGLITIAGGKLTGYRKMAETIVNYTAQILEKEEGLKFEACRTKNMPISGGHFGGSQRLVSFIEENRREAFKIGFTNEQYENLVLRYGSNINILFNIAKTYEPLNKYALPLELYVDVVYAIEEEMTVKPVDFFIRRTGALFFNIGYVQEWKKSVIELMADKLGWSERNIELFTEELERELLDAVQPSGMM
jgi:glycerol-3-phosphate dehydrogenase